jgi:hypothetical protein
MASGLPARSAHAQRQSPDDEGPPSIRGRPYMRQSLDKLPTDRVETTVPERSIGSARGSDTRRIRQ